MDNRKENTTVKYVLTMGIENDTMIKIAKPDNHRQRLKIGLYGKRIEAKIRQAMRNFNQTNDEIHNDFNDYLSYIFFLLSPEQ